jgi:hypothetical protein
MDAATATTGCSGGGRATAGALARWSLVWEHGMWDGLMGLSILRAFSCYDCDYNWLGWECDCNRGWCRTNSCDRNLQLGSGADKKLYRVEERQHVVVRLRCRHVKRQAVEMQG